MKNKMYFLLALAFILNACSEDDETKDISKNGSIETIIEVTHLNDKLDVLKTVNHIWINNHKVTTITHTDTIPGLGYTVQDAENSEGEIARIGLKKEYEMYITVK